MQEWPLWGSLAAFMASAAVVWMAGTRIAGDAGLFALYQLK